MEVDGKDELTADERAEYKEARKEVLASLEKFYEKEHKLAEYYQGICVALLGLMGFAKASNLEDASVPSALTSPWWFTFLATMVVLVALAWGLSAAACRDVVAKKNQTIRELEEKLTVKPNTIEWGFRKRQERTGVMKAKEWIPVAYGLIGLALVFALSPAPTPPQASTPSPEASKPPSKESQALAVELTKTILSNQSIVNALQDPDKTASAAVVLHKRILASLEAKK